MECLSLYVFVNISNFAPANILGETQIGQINDLKMSLEGDLIKY